MKRILNPKVQEFKKKRNTGSVKSKCRVHGFVEK